LILRKFGNHLRASNWPSILVELLVVIVGVYGAFQLENWGEELRENQRERMLLEQLHSEIEYAYPLMEAQVKSRKGSLNGARQVALRLMQAVESGDLDAEECSQLFQISVLRWNPLSLTTLDEMVSSGLHSQLDNRKLSTLLFSMKAEMNRLSVYMQLARAQQNILMDLYPELLPRGVDPTGESFMHCNTDGMRANQNFINHLMSNIGRYGGMAGNLEDQLASLREVHIKLDEVLQTSSTENTALHEDTPDR